MTPLYRIVSNKPKINVSLTPGPLPPQPTAGYGGWVEYARPKAIPFTIWEGGTARKQDISVMIDGFATGESVEADVELVKRLGRPPNQKDDTPPPVFRVFGPIHESGSRFVLEALEFGAVIRDDDGTILRQELTLKLIEYVDPDEIRLRRKKAQKKIAFGDPIIEHHSQIYEAKKGDTLKKIAAKFYGDASRWKTLSELNNIRDPNKKLTPGQKIKLVQ